jgi:hypothetical protein
MHPFDVRVAIDVLLAQQSVGNSHTVQLPEVLCGVLLPRQQAEMKHDLHYSQTVKAGSHVIDHDADTLGEAFELAYWRWLDDIERSKKYKAQQQRLPRDRRCNQSDELARDFVDHHKLRIFATAGPRHSRGCRNSDQNCHESQYCRRTGLPTGCDRASQEPP